MKIDWAKTMGIAGTILGLASTALTGMSQKEDMKKIIEKEVKKQLNNRK